MQYEAPHDAPPVAAYHFDSRLLLGTSLGVADIERFNRPSTIEPGSYLVDIVVNDRLFTRRSVEWRGEGGQVQPCLDDGLLASAGMLLEQSGADACAPLGQRVPGAQARFDLPSLTLKISVPQARMKQVPRGFVERKDLDAGERVGYLNYDLNHYASSSGGRTARSFYAGLGLGVNLGLWRLRQQSSYSAHDGQGRWNALRSYAERPLPRWNSRLVAGQDFTDGSLLSSVAYTGLRIESDERMLPDSMRGYAPVVTGVARTNARVVIHQNGNLLYQTTVAPGPFAIRDLYPTSAQGDLKVRVEEATGEVGSFTVPFSAVPQSLRPGRLRYGAVLGQVRQIQDSRAKFADLTVERGLSNTVTVHGAARLAQGYHALVGGLALSTRLGAWGMDIARSRTRDAQGHALQGWRYSASYSQTIEPTQTSFSLAAYRYSTRGFRDFGDALASRVAGRHAVPGWDGLSDSYLQRSQFTLSANQQLGEQGRYGALSVSASVANYATSARLRRPRDMQFQINYSHRWRSVSYSLALVRQRTGGMVGGWGGGFPHLGGKAVNLLMATVSIPLGIGARSAAVSSSLSSGAGQATALQSSVSGVADEARTLSYSLTASGRSSGGGGNLGASVQKSLPVATVGASASFGPGYRQAGVQMRGAAVVHGGGLTLGPYLGDTFGIVEAQGAEGARVRNGMGARIDGSGYALVPSLTPYRYNDISLDAREASPNVELETGERRVAPYAGAAVRLKFTTRMGQALLIQVRTADGKPLPLGADVRTAQGAVVGMVGQGSQAYVRVSERRGRLAVEWGEGGARRCEFGYDAGAADTAIVHAKAVCSPGTGFERLALTQKP
jgi:outer membrane usher protein